MGESEQTTVSVEDDDLPHPWRAHYDRMPIERDPVTLEDERAMRQEFESLVLKSTQSRRSAHLKHPDESNYPLCGRTEQVELDLFKTKPFDAWPTGWFTDGTGERICTYCYLVWEAGGW